MNGKLACTCCTPLVELELPRLSPPQFVSDWKTNKPFKLRERLQVNGKLACTCCTPLVDSELLSCHHHGFSLENDTPSTKKGCRCMSKWLVPAAGP